VWDEALPAPQRHWQLFNMASDFEEQHDMAAGNPDQFADLQKGWTEYATRNGVVY
jgi:hypothetical protein